ncbi:hypothetical protein EDD85DRAFT_605149 [Armillaria nabsnona]|nr:hypothetical protein EDD85DRAFT_605149 [Armillaria nabsnona]
MSEIDGIRSRAVLRVIGSVDFSEADNSLLLAYSNALTQYRSDFPVLLDSPYSQTSSVSEVTGLPPPSLPKDALGAQLRFFDNNPRHFFILYGRGEYDYAAGHNTQISMLHMIIQRRILELITGKSRPLTEEDQAMMNRWAGVQTFFEYYLPASDVGHQFEAEYGVNILARRTSEQNDPRWHNAYDRAKESIHKKYMLPILKQLSQHPKTRGTVPVDSNGEPIYDPKVYGRFAFIITKVSKKTGKACGDLH